jgi:hypothetical protein
MKRRLAGRGASVYRRRFPEHDPEKWKPRFSEKIMLKQKDNAGA